MRYFSLFSGIGGFELGIKRASDNQCSPECQEPTQKECKERGKWDSSERGALLRPGQQPSLCVGFSEINKYAIQVYQKHWPGHKNYGDATKINPSELPDFNMLCGGFPCQSFSIAGKRKGFEDTRGTLFHEILRIASEKRPGTIFLENVKGLLSADNGRCFGVIICSLDELGYDVEWQVLNSKNFGVPQNRERVFIIGHLRGCGGQAVFPLRQDDESTSEMARQKHAKQKRFWCGTLTGGQRNFGAGEFLIEAKGGNRIRRLTPVECERLQGFPDGWTDGISDSQRYKCLGNAVTVNVIQVIGETMLNHNVEG